MAVLVHDCPHCGSRHTSFQITKNDRHSRNNHMWNVLGMCPACDGPICFTVATSGLSDATALSGNLGQENRGDVALVGVVYPVRMQAIAPEHVPDAAADAFIEGTENAKDGRYSSAVMMFRRAIDVGTKQFEPTIDVHNLGKRIDKLAKDGLITKDLKDWAHKIRLEGNEAVHDLPRPTKEQTKELQLFTELVLTYLFTLPAKVKANLPAAE